MKKRVIAIAAAMVVGISMLSAGTFAWFSARSEAPGLGGNTGGTEDGIKGGIVAGHVDLRVTLDSYTKFAPGTNDDPSTAWNEALLAGERITQLGDYPGMLYPEDVVILPQSVTDSAGHTYDAGHVFQLPVKVQSVIEYSIENNSGAPIIASINQKGLGLNPDTVYNAEANNVPQNVAMGVYRLLGWDKMKAAVDNQALNFKNATTGNAYSTSEVYRKDGPTWFYYEYGPEGQGGGYIKFVDHRKLEQYGFFNVGKIYTPGAVATGFASYKWNSNSDKYTDTPFYDMDASNIQLVAGSTVDGIELQTILNPAAGEGVCEVVMPTNSERMYLYMPAGGITTVSFILSLPNYDNSDHTTVGNGVDQLDAPIHEGNKYQYAVFALDLLDPNNEDSNGAGGALVGYGVQAVQAAVDSFFGAGNWATLSPLFAGI